MEMTNMVKQIVDFQKSVFINAYNTTAMLQDQTEKIGAAFMEENPMVPQQTRAAMNDWVNLQKKMRDDYKKVIDESFKNLDAYFAETAKGK